MCIATISYEHAAYAAKVLSKRQRLRITCLRCPRPIYRELSCCYVYLLLNYYISGVITLHRKNVNRVLLHQLPYRGTRSWYYDDRLP